MVDEIEVPAAKREPAQENMLVGFDVANLYSVHTITDMKAGAIEVYTPIKIGGARDTDRPLKFLSSVAIAWQGRPMQVNFELPGPSIEDAIKAFIAVSTDAAQARIRELTDAARRRSILMPGSAVPPMKPLSKNH